MAREILAGPRLQVTFAQNIEVMSHVSGNDIG
jgi:hypothetical protein